MRATAESTGTRKCSVGRFEPAIPATDSLFAGLSGISFCTRDPTGCQERYPALHQPGQTSRISVAWHEIESAGPLKVSHGSYGGDDDANVGKIRPESDRFGIDNIATAAAAGTNRTLAARMHYRTSSPAFFQVPISGGHTTARRNATVD